MSLSAGLELYLRNYLNDEATTGNSYTQQVDTFNITTLTNTITLSFNPTPYESIVITVNSTPTTNFTISGAVVTFGFNLTSGQTVVATYYI